MEEANDASESFMKKDVVSKVANHPGSQSRLTWGPANNSLWRLYQRIIVKHCLIMAPLADLMS